MKRKLSALICFFLMLNIGACMQTDSVDAAADVAMTLANVPGRHFSDLSVHPNNEELLFLEFRSDLPEVSRLLRYHLKTQQLRYYELPKDYVTLDAAFSPSGKYIVMRRAPNVRGDENVKREAYSRSEIVVMKEDGSGLKQVPLSPGLKMAPAMSHDDAHIAYWRATQRPDGSKSFASGFDVWEVNLKTAEDRPFAGMYEFFEGGKLHYLSDSLKLLIGAGFPMSPTLPGRTNSNFSSWMADYQKKYNHSRIYLLERGGDQLPEPLMTNVNSPGYASVDEKENLYFQGCLPGTSFFRSAVVDKKLTQWPYPWKTISPPAVEEIVLPDGSAIAFVFIYKNEDSSKRGIGIVDTESASWSQINIPLLDSAKPISNVSFLQ
jgi:hypothetical protein